MSQLNQGAGKGDKRGARQGEGTVVTTLSASLENVDLA